MHATFATLSGAKRLAPGRELSPAANEISYSAARTISMCFLNFLSSVCVWSMR